MHVLKICETVVAVNWRFPSFGFPMSNLAENISYDIKYNPSHTGKAYVGMDNAYNFFNHHLFDNKLPGCLITFQRHKGAYGYFSNSRFSSTVGKVDEIALNPQHFGREPIEILSTLVHEMVHLWQQHLGKPPKGNYHNKQWGSKMKEIGLHPSSTGLAGGKETGQKVSHYIMPNGRFEYACAKLLEENELSLYIDNPSSVKDKKKKNASKTKYTCPDCDLNAWAKPDVLIQCVECDCRLVAETSSEPEEG